MALKQAAPNFSRVNVSSSESATWRVMNSWLSMESATGKKRSSLIYFDLRAAHFLNQPALGLSDPGSFDVQPHALSPSYRTIWNIREQNMQRYLLRCFLGIVCAFALSGCFEETVKQLVDKQFPPVDVTEYRKAAVSSGVAALAVVQEADLAAVIPIEDLRKLLDNTTVLKIANVKSVSIEGDKQILFVDIDVDGVFTSAMFAGMDAKDAAMLDTMKPKLVGTLRLGASITSAIASGDSSNLSLEFHLLPLFREVRIKDLTFAGSVDLASPADFAAKLINEFADNISGELSRATFTKLKIPALPVGSISTAVKTSETSGDGTKVAVQVEGQPIASPLFVRAVAFRIKAESISILVDLARTEDLTPPIQNAPAETNFSEFDQMYETRLSELVSMGERPSSMWVALSKSSLSQAVNSSFEQANLCVDIQASVPREDFSNKIEIPDENSVECTPTKDCTQTTDCRQTNDCSQTEDCSACILRAPRICVPNFPTGQSCSGGQCIQRGNDLICEGRKEGRRIDCERLKETNRLACEADKATKKVACEAEKSGTKALCETGKEVLKRLSRTGNFANVDGFAQASGALRICVPKLAFASDLAKLTMSLGVGGSADARIGIKFVPLDIIGHATCPVEWTEHKDIAVSIPAQNVSVSSDLIFKNANGALLITANVETSKVQATLSPSPRDLIIKNYNMELACPLVGVAMETVRSSTLLLDASGAIPELNGKFELPGISRSFEFEVDPIKIEVPTTDLSAETLVEMGEKSVLLRVMLK